MHYFHRLCHKKVSMDFVMLNQLIDETYASSENGLVIEEVYTQMVHVSFIGTSNMSRGHAYYKGWKFMVFVHLYVDCAVHLSHGLKATTCL